MFIFVPEDSVFLFYLFYLYFIASAYQFHMKAAIMVQYLYRSLLHARARTRTHNSCFNV